MANRGGVVLLAIVAALGAACGSSGGGGGFTALSGTVADQTDCAGQVQSIRPRSFVVLSFAPSVVVTSCSQARIQRPASLTAARFDGSESYDGGNMLAVIAVQNIRNVANEVDFTFDLRLSDIRFDMPVADPLAGDLTFRCVLAQAQDFHGQTADGTMLCEFVDAGDATVCAEGLQGMVVIIEGLRAKVKEGLIAFGCQDLAP